MNHFIFIVLTTLIFISIHAQAGEVIQREAFFRGLTKETNKARQEGCLTELGGQLLNIENETEQKPHLFRQKVNGRMVRLDLRDLNTPADIVLDVLTDLNKAEKDPQRRLDVRRFGLRYWDARISTLRLFDNQMGPGETDQFAKILFYSAQHVFVSNTDFNPLFGILKHFYADDSRLTRDIRYIFLSSLLAGVDIKRAIQADLRFKSLVQEWENLRKLVGLKLKADDRVQAKLKRIADKDPQLLNSVATPK